MRSNIGTGVLSGICGGILLGLVLQFVRVPAPSGDISLMHQTARLFGSDSIGLGWTFHLFVSAVVGALFGWLSGTRVGTSYQSGFGWGALYGFVWWVIAGLIVAPMLSGAPLLSNTGLGIGSLVGYLLAGLCIGGCYVAFKRYAPMRHAVDKTTNP
jgi:hypothetical protein